MDSELLPLVKTRHDVNVLISDIDVLIDGLYRTDEPQIRAKVKPWVMSLADDRQTKQQQLQAAKDWLKSREFFKLTLAFEPTEKIINQLVNWGREHIDPQLILDFYYEPGLIGGAVVEYQGKYADLSLRKRFDAL